MLALSAAFGGIALSGAAKAEPLTNLCLEVPLAPGPNRAEQMLAQMAWAGSLITTMQEGKDPELEAQVAQACSEGLFSITRRRNPPREVSGARLTIDGVAQPGTYAIEHDTGWTLSIKTTAKGKVSATR
jgi:hypothetical protein